MFLPHLKTIDELLSCAFASVLQALCLTKSSHPFSLSNPGILPMLNACREHDGLPRWLSRGQQVSHQRWIWGIHCAQARKHTIHPGFETQGKHHQKSKTGVSVAPQKGHVSSKIFQNKKSSNFIIIFSCSKFRFPMKFFSFSRLLLVYMESLQNTKLATAHFRWEYNSAK